jgi:hypothetical protein
MTGRESEAGVLRKAGVNPLSMIANSARGGETTTHLHHPWEPYDCTPNKPPQSSTPGRDRVKRTEPESLMFSTWCFVYRFALLTKAMG